MIFYSKGWVVTAKPIWAPVNAPSVQSSTQEARETGFAPLESDRIRKMLCGTSDSFHVENNPLRFVPWNRLSIANVSAFRHGVLHGILQALMLDLLSSSPLLFFLVLLAVVSALTFHEFGHAFIAYLLGDETAAREGRLTMNPIAHIDPLGLFMAAIVGFGWAKPVPFNPYNLKWRRWGPVAVSLAGPFFNLILAGIAAVLIHSIGSLFAPTNALMVFLVYLVVFNIGLLLFNLIPLPPLDGSRLLLLALDRPKFARVRHQLEANGTWILLGVILLDRFTNLGIFNGLSVLTNSLTQVLL